MKFLVTFERPGWYQPDHPRAKQHVLSLIVQAPDAQGAEVHALRTVVGDLGRLTTTPYVPTLAPLAVEQTVDVCRHLTG